MERETKQRRADLHGSLEELSWSGYTEGDLRYGIERFARYRTRLASIHGEGYRQARSRRSWRSNWQRVTPAALEQNRVLRHVLRSRWCYIIPRSNGRYVVGSTVEPGGFDKSLNRYRVKRLQDAAARLIPRFAEAKIAEEWHGLRPEPRTIFPCWERPASGLLCCDRLLS